MLYIPFLLENISQIFDSFHDPVSYPFHYMRVPIKFSMLRVVGGNQQRLGYRHINRSGRREADIYSWKGKDEMGYCGANSVLESESLVLNVIAITS